LAEHGQDYLYEAGMIQRLALYVTLGWVLDLGLGCHWDTWQFWSIMALFWCSDALTRIETIEGFRQSLESALAQAERQLAQAQARLKQLQDHKDLQ
jgi:hypothetical protein